VVFKYSNAEARARYKGHLASNTSKTLLNNSQRKIVFDGERYHLAYVDNGEVYYTYFNNTAGEWERDVRISHGEGGCAFPAISAVRNGEDNYVMVVWQEFNDSYHGVYSRMKVNDTWYTPREVKYINSDYYEATPVVDYMNGYFHILWRDFENYYPLWTEKNLKVRPSNIINQQFGEIVSIAETDKYSLHPSMASDDAGHLHIAWEESGQIYYVALRYSDNEYDYFTDKECVSAETGYQNHCNPSITTNGSNEANIMWQANYFPLEKQIILHAIKAGAYPNEWQYSSFIGVQDDDYTLPTIAGFPCSQSDILQAAWEKNYTTILRATYSRDYWQWQPYSTGIEGCEPGMSRSRATTTEYKFAYRKYNSAPYLIKVESEGKSNLVPVHITKHRKGVLSMGNIWLSLELGEFQMNGEEITLMPYSDSLFSYSSGNWRSIFRTVPFTVSGSGTLSYYREFRVHLPDSLGLLIPPGKEIKIKLEIVDVASGQVLAVPDVQIIGTSVPPNSLQHMQASFTIPGIHEVYLRVGLEIPRGLNLKGSLVEVYRLDESVKLTSQKILEPEEKSITLPKKYALYPNYPNPFNPTTTIAFDLPEQARVELTVYDISGRKIRTLASGNYAACSHQVLWDGRDEQGTPVASGVYVYRLVAGEHVFTRKMILMK
jgi:hypothetical protein